MRISTPARAALAILAVVAIYFGARAAFRGPAVEMAANGEEELFAVVATEIAPQAWRDTVRVRGRTEAARKVTVRAETAGPVAETPVPQGSPVRKGDTLCRLELDARRAALEEARAAKRQAQLDYNAAEELATEGFRSETSLAAFKAALDRASAGLEQAEVNLGRTEITAPFDGVFDTRVAEVGDYLAVGDPCGVVIEPSPFLVTGAVSERQVAKISEGDPGRARLVTGEIVEGVVRFVAAAADPATRTFAVELEVPNENGELRDGVTAEFEVFANKRDAHLVPHSALTLDDDGRVGVRVVDDAVTNGAGDGIEGVVRFTPVRLIAESPEGVWAEGIDGAALVITRGQDYVRAGERVAVARPEAAS